jgi:hypothetical protein
MDDYTSNILNDSKNEWSILLINYITPHIIDGFKSIFNESVNLCEQNDEIEKYLMTFQNLLSRIPKWNQTVVLEEQSRIVTSCNCTYLEDLITCVHIIQLKILSCVRVGSETKKITIDVPDMSSFIHQIYINIARKLYSNIYLFEIDIPPLEQQRRNREFELIVQTCIMNTIRDKIPVETLLRQFIDETQEVEVTRVEKTLNTIAKPLDPVPINPVNQMNSNNQIESLDPMNQSNFNESPINSINQMNQMNQMNPSMNQMSPMNSMNQMNPMNPMNSMSPMNQSNLNQDSNTPFDRPSSFDSRSFDSRKQSISFNPEPSILEIEPREVNSDIKLDGISFEDLDSAPVNLDFEEL